MTRWSKADFTLLVIAVGSLAAIVLIQWRWV